MRGGAGLVPSHTLLPSTDGLQYLHEERLFPYADTASNRCRGKTWLAYESKEMRDTFLWSDLPCHLSCQLPSEWLDPGSG